MALSFAKMMATVYGRGVRVLAGLLLIALALFALDGTAAIVVFVVALLPLLAGLFNFCAISLFIGAPFSGKDALSR